MPRILVAVALAFAVLAVPASAAPKKGPGGAGFYKPPKHLKGTHGGLIWVHKQTGEGRAQGRAADELLLYRSKDLSGKVTAVSGSVALPKGKAPKGGWPVITYAHGTTGAADACAPTKRLRRGQARQLRVPAAQALAEGRLRGRAHRLRRARDAGRAPVPGRRRPRAAACSTRCAPRARFDAASCRKRLHDRRALAGRPRGAVRRRGWRRSTCPSSSCAARSRSRPPRTSKTQFQTTLELTAAGGGLGAIVGLGLRADRHLRPSLGVPSLLTPRRAGAVPADQDGLLRRARASRLVRRRCR